MSIQAPRVRGTSKVRKNLPRRSLNSVREGDGHLDTATQNHLGRILKESYDNLLNQPLPDRFVELLDELSREVEPKK